MEETYHYLCQSPHEHLPKALNGFVECYLTSSMFAYQWAKTIQQAGEDTENIKVQQWGKLLTEGLTENPKTSYSFRLQMINVLISDPIINPKWQRSLLNRRVRLYSDISQYELSLVDLNTLLEETPDDVSLLLMKIVAFLMLNRREEALQVLLYLIKVNPKFIRTLRDSLIEKVLVTKEDDNFLSKNIILTRMVLSQLKIRTK